MNARNANPTAGRNPITVLVTGADDVWGSLTAEAVLRAGELAAPGGGSAAVGHLVLTVHDSPWSASLARDPRVTLVDGKISDEQFVEGLFASTRVDSVFHFETVTRDRGSGERDFDAMLNTNLMGSLHLLESARLHSPGARFVFCSSCSVFADNLGSQVVSDDTRRLPSATYGTTKAAVELLINDYARRGYVDGRSSILPMCVSWRPDERSVEFLHGVFECPFADREEIVGLEPEVQLWLNGYSTCIANLLELHDVDGWVLGDDRGVLQPGVKISVAEMIDTFKRVGEDEHAPVARFSFRPDANLQQEFQQYPKHVEPRRASALGLSSEDFEALVRRYLRDLRSVQ